MKTQYDVDMEYMKKRKENAAKRQSSLDETINKAVTAETEAKTEADKAKKKEDTIKKRTKFAKDKKNYKDFNYGKTMS